MEEEKRQKLEKICQLLRYLILTSTTKAGSGHPTSSLSAVELMAVLFFAGFFFDDKDKIIFSKGHASPLLYSLYAVMGKIEFKELETLRQFKSRLEGHPTPRLQFIDVATGSLGQGLSIGLGMALAKKIKNEQGKIFVLLGDSEVAEGQIYEALALASFYRLDNLVAIVDINRLGQRGETMIGWNLLAYQRRFSGFDWQVYMIDDDHNLELIYKTYWQVFDDNSSSPKIILAKTIKGKGVSFLENQNGWHGKVLNKQDLDKALLELGKVEMIIENIDKKNLENKSQNEKEDKIVTVIDKLKYYVK
ncbi:MAG: hypothetical protein Fur009_6850 [Candidatus Microgenomates bacterium]